MVTKMRESKFELLRIICILLILIMHYSYPLSQSEDIQTKIVYSNINSLGNCGVSLFVLISGYFGIKYSFEKVGLLWGKTFFISVLTTIVAYIIQVRQFSFGYSVQSVFPILTNKYWFATSYIILLLVSPVLNQTFDALDKKRTEKLLMAYSLFFVIAPTILQLEILNDTGKGPINMCFVYLLGRYICNPPYERKVI